MKVLTVVLLFGAAAAALVFGVFLREKEAFQRVFPGEEILTEVISPQEIDLMLREMPIGEVTATTSTAIERRLRLAAAIAEEGRETDITDCVANPLVLKIENDDEFRFKNRTSKQLLLLIGQDYYTVPPNGFLTLRAGNLAMEENNNLLRYVCGEGEDATTRQGFILVNY